MPPFPSPTPTWHTETYPSLSPTRPELSARGKSILITGGGSGIGAETALYFARAGATRIGLLGRREQALLATKSSIEQQFPQTAILAIPTDIQQADQVDAAFRQFVGTETKTEASKIDVLVSNAATLGPLARIRDLQPDAFLDYVSQSLSGTLAIAQAFLKHAAQDAVIINTSSYAVHLDSISGLTAYGTAKTSIVRFWDYLVYENPSISLFHVQPGIVDTKITHDAGGIESLGQQDHASLPASFNVWLASPEARFLRGKFVWANWDVDELKSRAGEIKDSAQLRIGLVGWPFEDAR
ncbi:hypothetical protein DSL72_009436 [Monilinia vaccinii-corymbosi]|uniref:Ketoreductase domain-containing protein n=1 Tax=Monilinia vaccinii-corymbosi TaxID=61207 RepID=A0A8A3PPH2_9HELO|nr:hypothetical protein DSL72_009436 [Monilinia vaccinii-corymbosi]